MTMPCRWTVACNACSGWEDYSQEVQDSALWLASTWLWAATGRQYGICDVTVLPVQSRACAPMAYVAYPVIPGMDPAPAGGGPYLLGGRWFNGGCNAGCCGVSCSIVLDGPVASVSSVTIDGETVPASQYRVDVTGGEYHLVRLGGDCWPTCANAQGSAFEVTYGRGRALPDALQIATSLLACEYAKHLAGGTCVLPAQMTRLSRQGVEVEVATPSATEAMDRTGIAYVDRVVQSLNPSRRERPPVLLSPDLPNVADRRTIIAAGS